MDKPDLLKIITRETCWVCGSDRLIPLFSLGTQYVNNFIDRDELDRCIKDKPGGGAEYGNAV